MNVTTTGLAIDYVIRVNGCDELSGHLRQGDKVTFCYVPAECSVLEGKSNRFIRSTVHGQVSGMIKVDSWERCHSSGGVLEHMDWVECNLLGMVQCEMAEWCM